MPKSTNDRQPSTKTDLAKIDAGKQIEAIVNSGDTAVLVDFLTEEQRKQLAEDWNQGRDF